MNYSIYKITKELHSNYNTIKRIISYLKIDNKKYYSENEYSQIKNFYISNKKNLFNIFSQESFSKKENSISICDLNKEWFTMNSIHEILNITVRKNLLEYLNINTKEFVHPLIGRKYNFINKDDFYKIKNFIENNDWISIMKSEGRKKINYSEKLKKIKTTKLEKYGDENYNNVEKAKETSFNKYGKNHYSMTNDFKNKLLKTRNNKIKNFEFENNCVCLKDVKFKYYHDYKLISKTVKYLNSKIIIYNNTCFVEKQIIDKLIELCDSNNKHIVSESEKEICDFIKSLNIEFIENTRQIIKPKELDVYIPSKKIAIEYNGIYYHSDFRLDKNYHLNKTKMCNDKNIRLIHIFSDQWINSQDICKSIIKSSLGIYERKLFARKCDFKKVDNFNACEFLSENHIQGSINGESYGLYYNDELVQLITIGKSRFKKNEIELYRMCTKLNTQVVGGFSKLMKHQPYKELISFVDLSLFDAKGYERCGWKYLSQTKPNYFYCKNGQEIRLNRLEFQKHKLKDKLKFFDDKLTEYENMINNGYFRFYDCGNLKLKWSK